MLSRDPLRALRAAQRCLGAYDYSSWKSGHSQALLGFHDGVQYISFAGTNDLTDVFNDLCLLPFVERHGLGFARNGFWDAFKPVKEWLDSLLTSPEYSPGFVIEGHSLGAFLAQATARYLEVLGHKVYWVETFGCPSGWGKSSLAQFEGTDILNWKNSWDAVYGRPLLTGSFPGERAGLDDTGLLEQPKNALWVSVLNHGLEGSRGYIARFLKLCPGMTSKSLSGPSEPSDKVLDVKGPEEP